MTRVAIVLGKIWKKERRNGVPQLSMEAKMTALAAGQMYCAGKVDLLIFTGGHTAGAEYPSEARAMAEYCKEKCRKIERVRKQYRSITDTAIMLEEEAFDTITNARLVRKMLSENKIRTTPFLLTRRYHLKRAERIFLREGIQTWPTAVEDIFMRRTDRHAQLGEKYLGSYHYRLCEAKELLVRIQLAVDPDARIQRFITRRERHAKEK